MWGGKGNFVDENNVFVGYDMGQSWCEYADWFIVDEPKDTIHKRDKNENLDLEGWIFDVDYFKEVDNGSEFDCGGMVIFKITKDSDEKFLHLFNCHNGYYSHGFSFGVNDVTKKEGYL